MLVRYSILLVWAFAALKLWCKIMNNILQILEESSLVRGDFTAGTILLSLLLAFVLGQVLAWVYYFTHSGLSYSKSFVQSLILITIVISLVMSTIANSFVTAVGLMGALSIIRFRNMIKTQGTSPLFSVRLF